MEKREWKGEGKSEEVQVLKPSTRATGATEATTSTVPSLLFLLTSLGEPRRKIVWVPPIPHIESVHRTRGQQRHGAVSKIGSERRTKGRCPEHGKQRRVTNGYTMRLSIRNFFSVHFEVL